LALSASLGWLVDPTRRVGRSLETPPDISIQDTIQRLYFFGGT
jgi:hypothetical protein